MATDLEFRQTQLPAIRLRPIKIRSNLKPLSSNNNIHNINNNNKDLHQGGGGGGGGGVVGCQSGGDDYYDDDDDVDEEEEEEVESAVVTPTSAESKIPTALSCPPAPIKPRRVILCKRKLCDELQFFEITSNGRHQVESFFRSSYESSSSSSSSNSLISRRFKKTKIESNE